MLSSRGADNLEAGEDFESLVKLLTNLYDEETNPNGIVSLGVAENGLMHKELADYFAKIDIKPHHLTYGDGPYGSRVLREGLSTHLNKRLHALYPVTTQQMVVASGVTSVLDIISFALADEDDGFLIGRPLYTNFHNDLMARSKVKLVAVSSQGADPMGLEMVEHYGAELVSQEEKGTKIKGLILCNPHNPLGKCYSKEVIMAYMRLCEKHKIHFISDEVYALSVFINPDFPNANTFTSALSIDISGLISPDLVHVLYGMSKDFACNGFRCGVLVSQRNKELLVCAKSIACFSWPSSISDHLLSTLLKDSTFLDFYFSENQRRLAANYSLVTACLTSHSIEYVPGGNSGFFVWADFRKFLGPDVVVERGLCTTDEVQSSESMRADSKPVLRKSQVALTTPKAASRDTWFQEKLAGGGVFIATGNAFFSEMHGFYRVTFSLPEETLKLGLERLGRVIKDIRSI